MKKNLSMFPEAFEFLRRVLRALYLKNTPDEDEVKGKNGKEERVHVQSLFA